MTAPEKAPEQFDGRRREPFSRRFGERPLMRLPMMPLTKRGTAFAKKTPLQK
jgi:hypothetical protein